MKRWARSFFNKKHLVTLLISIVAFLATIVLFSDTTASLSEYRSFLKTREYNYSVEINKDIGQDTYAYYDKTITFSSDESLDKTINAVVLMELNNEHSSNDFLKGYDATALTEFEVIISNNIAIKNHITIGSYLYSKSKVDNTIGRYTVRDIVPDVYGLKENDTSKNKGIIITGKSESYLKNIAVSFLFFYRNDFSLISSRGAAIVGELTSIASIKKEINKEYFFYLAITFILSTILIAITLIVLARFNKAIYIKKKSFGVKNLYTIMALNTGIYYLILLASTASLYMLLCLLIRFSLAQLIMFILVLTVFTVGSVFFERRSIKGR